MTGCPACGSTEPHAHHLAAVLNSRYFCPDGEEHNWIPLRYWIFWRRNRCVRCDEWEI